MVLDQVLDSQALDANRLVLANDASRELVLIVATAIGNACMDAGHFASGFLTIAGALVLLAQTTLGQLLLITGEEFGIANRRIFPSQVKALLVYSAACLSWRALNFG